MLNELRPVKRDFVLAESSSKSKVSGRQHATAKTRIGPLEQQDTNTLIEEGLRLATPAWPLQNAVAVNPFWFYRGQRFEDTLAELSTVVHHSLYMPLHYYRQKFLSGEISEASLVDALNLARGRWDDAPSTVEELLSLSKVDESVPRMHKTFAEQLHRDQYWHRLSMQEIGKYAAAYLDDRQAVARLPWQGDSFWFGWLKAQAFDRTMAISGAMEFDHAVEQLADKKPHEAIAFMLDKIGIINGPGQLVYLRRLMVTSLGWASQFKYLEWQKALGYQVSRDTTSADLLAVCLAYDFGLILSFAAKRSSTLASWVERLNEVVEAKSNRVLDSHLHYIWQTAFEHTYQRRIVSRLKPGREDKPAASKAQMVFCIDVRSEMIRRHIEHVDGGIETIGFAGFFGVPFQYQKLDEKVPGNRLPVLLSPAFAISECTKDHENGGDLTRLNSDILSFSYFRNLRKLPMASLLFVELFGILSVARILRRNLHHLIRRIKGRQVPSRFAADLVEPQIASCQTRTGEPLDITGKVERAASVLQHLGLKEGFAPLVVIVGHGSETTNNAFGSALDCGACGGHAGDINARVLVNLLNDRDIRDGLARQKSIEIPDATWFVAAVHETVTDEIFILDDDTIPAGKKSMVRELQRSLRVASGSTRQERLAARSDVLEPNSCKRAHDWSEVRPEWGLSGNASFIVAPRKRTRGVNLSSRAFLHNYDWTKDTGFKTLELIMTAPMVVTNWINMQYYGSTVVPGVYGAGSKVLHNLTNETGVVEGNGGDLRVGLPIESVHDGSQFVHEPLRLSVFIEAPREEIEDIISKHEVVKDLVENEWLFLLHIDPFTTKVTRRLSGGIYQAV